MKASLPRSQSGGKKAKRDHAVCRKGGAKWAGWSHSVRAPSPEGCLTTEGQHPFYRQPHKLPLTRPQSSMVDPSNCIGEQAAGIGTHRGHTQTTARPKLEQSLVLITNQMCSINSCMTDLFLSLFPSSPLLLSHFFANFLSICYDITLEIL